MTKRKAEAITGLEIHIDQDPIGTTVVTGASSVRAVQGYGEGLKALSKALHDLVERNFRIVVNEAILAQGMKCARCGRMLPLSGHHKTHRSKARRDSIENIEALCAGCHHQAHGGLRRAAS